MHLVCMLTVSGPMQGYLSAHLSVQRRLPLAAGGGLESA